MIALLAIVMRVTLKRPLVAAARAQADQGLAGSMEGHAGMDMSIQAEGPLTKRLFSAEGRTAVSHIFVMEWAAVLRDVVIGLLLAGAAAAWIPESFWRSFFLSGHPLLAKVWGPVIGPVVAVLSFVCSIGNVPLAGVLWNGGISFGGVISFIYADLIILPIILIYRKYYGTKAALYLTGTFYVTMVAAGYVVEAAFALFHLVPGERNAKVMEAAVTWNYTTVLNLVAIAFTLTLLVRFIRSDGLGHAQDDGRRPARRRGGRPRCSRGTRSRRGARSRTSRLSSVGGDFPSSPQSGPDLGEAFRDEGPPCPATDFLAGEEARFGEDLGVMADRRLALAQRFFEIAGADTAIGGDE